MRAVRSLTGISASPEQPWLPGLPHAVAGLSPAFVFGLRACVTGLLLATLASFVVYLPLIALGLNGGRPIAPEAAAPILTAPAKWSLLLLWTVTAWLAAALA